MTGRKPIHLRVVVWLTVAPVLEVPDVDRQRDLGASRGVAAGDVAAPDAERLLAAGTLVVLGLGPDDEPVPGDAPQPGEPGLCATPPDIETDRRERPAHARDWRHALRSALGGALDRGWRATGISRSGWYVLEPPEART